MSCDDLATLGASPLSSIELFDLSRDVEISLDDNTSSTKVQAWDVPGSGTDTPATHVPDDEDTIEKEDQTDESVEQTEEVEKSPPSLWSMSRRNKLKLLCLVLGAAESSLCLSLLAPFYPGEAQERGISEFVASWVFSVFSLTQFLAAPLFGKMVPVVGQRFMYVCGAFVCGGCTILFGCLDMFSKTDGPTLFITFSFLIRIVMALGSTAMITSEFAIASTNFHENTATVIGFIETFTGLGFMGGPAIGGLLYQVGGFFIPFLVCGLSVFLIIPVSIIVLKAEPGAGRESGAILPLLRVPDIVFVCVMIMTSAMMLISLDPILELHLEEFGLNSSLVGLLFLLYSGMYAIMSPIAGYLVDRVKDSTYLLMLGFFGMAIGYLLIGPSPLLGLYQFQYLWLNVVAMIVIGIFGGFAITPTFDRLSHYAKLSGLDPDALSTHAAVSGLWTSAYALGETVGPILAGWLTEDLNFAWCTTILGLIALFMIILWLNVSLVKYFRSRSTNQDELLIQVTDDPSPETL